MEQTIWLVETIFDLSMKEPKEQKVMIFNTEEQLIVERDIMIESWLECGVVKLKETPHKVLLGDVNVPLTKAVFVEYRIRRVEPCNINTWIDMRGTPIIDDEECED